MTIDLRHGDCLEVMRTLAAGSVDALVTDPPAGIRFMGKAFDSFTGRSAFVDFLTPRLAEARRVCKPGAYALVWALPRTSHWTGLAVEDAGWVIRDRVSHLFGVGFPKSKACLKPACEDWWLAWNPTKGVTPLRIDESRIGTEERPNIEPDRYRMTGNSWGQESLCGSKANGSTTLGRWPANVTHDGSPEVLAAFAVAGERASNSGVPFNRRDIGYHGGCEPVVSPGYYGDSGSAARFFFCSKASKRDRERRNSHPTVKATPLMRWLIGLITEPDQTVLDCFMGSGSTGVACHQTNRRFLGIESDPHYYAISQRRLARQQARYALFPNG